MIVSQVNGTFCSRFHWSNTILQRRTGSLLCVANVFSVAISISSWMPSSYHLVGIFLATRFISLEIFGAWEYLPVKITNIQIKLCNLKLLQKPLVVNTFTVLPAVGVWGTAAGIWGTAAGVWGTTAGVWGTVNNWTNYTLRTECTMCELAKTRVTQLIKMAASVYTLTLCSQQLLLRISYSEGSERWDSSDNHFVT